MTKRSNNERNTTETKIKLSLLLMEMDNQVLKPA